jgi:RimJ/RimL family protein N-acetyltransferase
VFGPVLRGEKCTLRPLRKEEAETYIGWFKDLDVIRYTLQIGPMSIWQEEDFIKRMADERNAISWIIEVDGRPVGWTGVGGINWRNGNGESGIVIGEKSVWRRGVGSEAMALRTSYCFRELNLHKIRTRVYIDNEASKRALQKSGYRESGIQREEAFRDGRHHDIWCGEVLREDWERAQRDVPTS